MKKFNGSISLFEEPKDGEKGKFIRTFQNPTRNEVYSLKQELDGKGVVYMVNYYPVRPKVDLEDLFDQGEEEFLIYICGKDPSGLDRKVYFRFYGGYEPKNIKLILTEEEFLDFHSNESWTKMIKFPFYGFDTRKTGDWTIEQLWEGASHGMEVKSPFTNQWIPVWEPSI